MLGKEITLHRSTDQGGTYGSAIADIWNIQAGEQTVETLENHTHGGTNWKEYEYGLLDGGEATIVARYKASQTDVDAIADAMFNGTKEYVQFQFPAPISRSLSFRCLVTKVGHVTEQGQLLERSLTLKVDGAVTQAALA